MKAMKAGDWPFDQPGNYALFTIRQILERKESILHVSHDAEDHGWQFPGWEDARVEDAKIICLEEVIAVDSSILQLADLPPGWHAWRQSISGSWMRES